jgi:HAMP domain-containing protein
MSVIGKKAEKVWAYLVKHPKASSAKVAKACGCSPSYVYLLKKKIGTPKEVLEEVNLTVTRADVLDTAKDYVTKDRAAEHGDMENNFNTIARYWSVHLDAQITPTDVAVMMNLLKVARIKSNPKSQDNWVDGAGYMACGGEIASALRA